VSVSMSVSVSVSVCMSVSVSVFVSVLQCNRQGAVHRTARPHFRAISQGN